MAQQRQQQFRKLPGDSPPGSASLPVGPISCSRNSNYQSGRLRTARLQVRFLPGVPICRVSPTTRGAPLRTERLGLELPHAAPFGLSQDRARRSRPGDQLAGGLTADSCALGASTIRKAPVAQRRGGGLKPRSVSVQIRPGAPSACSPISRGVPLKTGRLQVQVLPRGPILECQPGKRTGPVC